MFVLNNVPFFFFFVNKKNFTEVYSFNALIYFLMINLLKKIYIDLLEGVAELIAFLTTEYPNVRWFDISPAFAKGSNVAIAAYESCWFNFNVKQQKSLHLFMLKSQKPCAVSLTTKIYTCF